MHKQVVIIGAGPSGLLLARMLHNRGIDCLILENRNKIFLSKKNRGGFLEDKIVKTLVHENVSQNILEKGIPINQIDFHIDGEKISQNFNETNPNKKAIIFDQQNLVKDMLTCLKDDKIPIIFEAKAQRYEGLENDKAKIIYTLNGQLYDMTCDYVVGCDGYSGISRRSIPRDIRKEEKTDLDYAWLEWIVEGKPESIHPIIAFHKDGFAMQTINANNQTRFYLQIERGIEKDDLPPQEIIWEELEKRLGVKTKRGEAFHRKLDYMRSFYTNSMQHGRLLIAGDAAHQVPRFGSKGINMALADSIYLAEAFFNFYKKNDKDLLENYTQQSLEINVKKLNYTNFINQVFHRNVDSNFDQQKNQIKYFLTEEKLKKEFLTYILG